MDQGNWVPIDKRLSKFFPDSPYSKIEAAFSLAIDYDNDNQITLSGYAKLWGWSRTKVSAFFEEMGIEIIYPENTEKVQKQKGQIKKQKKNSKETVKRQIRFIETKASEGLKDRKKTEEGQKKNRSKSTTSYPSLNPNPKPIKKDILKPENVSDQTWKDFLIHRKSKKASVTQTVINNFTKQAELAEMSLESALIESISRGWSGFKAEWMKSKAQNRFEKPRQKTGDEIFADEFPNGSTQKPKDITPIRIKA